MCSPLHHTFLFQLGRIIIACIHDTVSTLHIIIAYSCYIMILYKSLATTYDYVLTSTIAYFHT
jgi:hypothetical protein